MVPEIIIGSSTPSASNSVFTAKTAALALRVSKRFQSGSGPRHLPPALWWILDKPPPAGQSDVAECRIVDVRRNRRRAVGRAENTGNVARFLRRAAVHSSAQARASFAAAKLISADRIPSGNPPSQWSWVEGVGFDDITHRFKVGVVDRRHFRFAEHQQVVVAFEIARPVGKTLATRKSASFSR